MKSKKQNNLENKIIVSFFTWPIAFIGSVIIMIIYGNNIQSWYALFIGFPIFAVSLYIMVKTSYEIKELKAKGDWIYDSR